MTTLERKHVLVAIAISLPLSMVIEFFRGEPGVDFDPKFMTFMFMMYCIDMLVLIVVGLETARVYHKWRDSNQKKETTSNI